MGAVGIGTHRGSLNNIGIIPVNFTKTDIGDPETVVLMNGVRRGLTVRGGGMHDRVFVDIPPGISSFTISTSLTGTNNEALEMELYRLDFDNAFTDVPFATAPDISGAPLASASGTVDNGPTLTLSGNDVVPGRWYVVIKNSSGAHANVEVRADLEFTGTAIPLRAGLWQSASRTDNQGYEYSKAGGYRAFLWYTYDEEGRPAWYQAAAPESLGNVWVATLLRYTNDGSLQQATPVGHVSITQLAEEDSIFSFVLFGENGSDRERPSFPVSCPTVDDLQRSYNGAWSRTAAGVGGATVLVNHASQAFVHYLYDELGKPIWLIGAPEVQSANLEEMSMWQYGGYCAVCSENEITTESVGIFTRVFASEEAMTWNLNYMLKSPLSGTVDRSDDTTKLTTPVACQ
jgi:hypothetical protein